MKGFHWVYSNTKTQQTGLTRHINTIEHVHVCVVLSSSYFQCYLAFLLYTLRIVIGIRKLKHCITTAYHNHGSVTGDTLKNLVPETCNRYGIPETCASFLSLCRAFLRKFFFL